MTVDNYEDRVLILAPTQKDALLTANLLKADHISSLICRDVPHVCQELSSGASALVLAQEFVLTDKDALLQKALSSQEAWSDIPVILLTVLGRDLTRALDRLAHIGHMTLIKRPVQLNNFISTIRSALRDRKRQYRIRDHLAERVLHAQQLEEAVQKANAANLAKSDFLANMSHEIRTPMNAVMGLAHLLERSSPLNDKQRQCIETLRLSGESLLILINDLLDIAKIEASGIELEMIDFELDHLITQVIEVMSVRAAERGLRFITEIHQIAGRTYQGDPNRIRQVLTNLCSNAVKFSSNDVIKVRITCDYNAPNQLRISVEDHGVGISEEKLASIFEKFTQADNTISRKYGGTGLGLAISKKLCELMGGSIEVESEVGKGSIFSAVLPLKVISPLNENREAIDGGVDVFRDNGAAPLRGRILLVEDYQPNILVASSFLEMFGYGFDIAESGTLAVEKVKQNRYVAILMDVQMPEMNGLDATRAIRQFEAEQRRAETPILGMTAHALDGDRDRCIKAGMDDYISKPFSPNDLAQKLESLIAR